jgi:hypothetical protein
LEYSVGGLVKVLCPGKQVAIDPRAKTVKINGAPQANIGKIAIINGRCYVPIEALQKVAPLLARYDAPSKCVRITYLQQAKQ